MKLFTKTKIIEKVADLSEKYDKKEIGQRAWLDRLNESIALLRDDVILNSEKFDDADSNFSANQLNLEAKIIESPRKTHYFEPMAATFLIAFLALYEHPFTKSYMKGSLIKKEISLQWFEEIEKITPKIVEDVFMEEPSKVNYCCINIISQFSKLARREQLLSRLSIGIDKRIVEIVSKILALNPEDKTLMYEEKIEKLFNKIEMEIDNKVDKFNASEKELYNFDVDLILNKDKATETIKQIYSNSGAS
ncbi:hypothetical protein CJ194_23690 [Priestia megaterium]|uniref:hypothetical protein n=1 Tax=Priestia megaterium TaxID=1404 RepID=UPI000C80E4C0|nr:hypothetical protein [Priestia megaterium]PMD07607.1 hypothetical protein CJ194_23690 [Priestia megaterium]